MLRTRVTLATVMLVAAIAISTVAREYTSASTSALSLLPEMVELPPGTFDYRASGAFTRDGKPVSAPKTTVVFARALAMMKHQVTAADYRRCIDAGACPAAARDAMSFDRPAVKISWQDASAYAAWLSRETNAHFRLPTDAEWAYAAAGRFEDDALPKGIDNNDPGKRELAIYEREANSASDVDQTPRPIGSFGANESGLLDLAGNVWEWTDTCFTRGEVDAHGVVTLIMPSCGVRVVEGRHRTYLSDFIRDARGGGCAFGTPPSNLGFRLIRDDDRASARWDALRRLLARVQQVAGFRA